MKNKLINNKEKVIIISIVAVITVISVFLLIDMINDKDNIDVNVVQEEHNNEQDEVVVTPNPVNNSEVNSNYNISIIKEFNKQAAKKNYLLSPYNIEIALNMLKVGALGNTKLELDKVLGNRKINDVSVNGKIGIANALFIKDQYKEDVKKDFYSILDKEYHADIIYDEFTSPTKINNWVKVKTNGMIDKILDKIDDAYVMGLASALSIDVKWAKNFECINTKPLDFTKINKEKITTEMMHNTYDRNAKYFSTKEAKGVILPYVREDNSAIELEFVGILPNNDIDSFINNLNQDKLNSLLTDQKEASDSFNIKVSLPRFKYDFDAKEFIKILNNLGINDAFNPNTANFKGMIETKENVYVGEAIHKTHIELNEVGTKAASVTYFGMYKNSIMEPQEKETVEVKFDKPFAYMIRERNTGEILFFGSVYEPNQWNGSTCENQ